MHAHANMQTHTHTHKHTYTHTYTHTHTHTYTLTCLYAWLHSIHCLDLRAFTPKPTKLRDSISHHITLILQRLSHSTQLFSFVVPHVALYLTTPISVWLIVGLCHVFRPYPRALLTHRLGLYWLFNVAQVEAEGILDRTRVAYWMLRLRCLVWSALYISGYVTSVSPRSHSALTRTIPHVLYLLLPSRHSSVQPSLQLEIQLITFPSITLSMYLLYSQLKKKMEN